jgi:MFS family permease
VPQLINRDYTRLWYGQAISVLGDYVFNTTLALWVAIELGKGHSWAPAAMSGVLLTAGAAVLVVGPAAGVFVDRWNRKALMLRTEVVRAVLVGALAGLAFVPERTLSTGAWLALIYVTVFMVNAAGQFFSPARLAILGEIVPGDADRARASGIEQASSAAAAIIGPPLAAPLLFTAGIQWALVFNALSYVVSYVAIRSVRTTRSADAAVLPGPPGGFRSEFGAGLRYFARSQFLVTMLALAVIAQLGTGALNTLDIFFLTRNLHTAGRLYGLLSTAFGVGAVIGGLASGRVVRWIGARTLLWLGAVVAGLLVLVYARQTAFAAALVLVVLLALTVTLLNTAFTPLLLKAAPPEYLGRVVAVFMPVNTLASMLSMAVAGWLASSALHGLHGTVLGVHIGPIDTIWSVAALLMIAAGGFGMLALPREVASAPAQVAAERV